MTALPAFEAFESAYQKKENQLVYRWFSGDLETPVSAYLKLCAHSPYCLLLESVEGGASLGRYSIIGYDPDLIWRCRNGQAETETNDKKTQAENALADLRALIKNCHIPNSPAELPPMAVSGLFGYMGYDMVRLVEKIPAGNPDPLGIPDSIMIRPRMLAIFDNVRNMICLVAPTYFDASKDAQNIYDDAQARINDAIQKLNKPVDAKLTAQKSKLKAPLSVSSNMTQEDYKSAVEKAVDYIHQGEIFQVVPAQRFSVDFDLPSIDFYRALRKLNPSPFLFHLSFDGFSIVGSSPEILVRVRDGTVTIRPIAGTRKRGADEAEDKALAEELLADPKERAEHLMLLDLGRNDVGRTANFGTVNVTDQFTIERYSHVMHIVSNVEGKLRDDLDIIDALFAGFPAGTVSGAPKIRAMEIIEELEPEKRTFYAGSVGYLSGNGQMDTCIALRTGLIKDGKLYVQAGGGVVADSDPEFEYQETVNKAKALIRAAEIAVENS